MNTPQKYAELIQPSWAPPSWLFGPVWTVLYAIIIYSFGAVFYRAATHQIPPIVALPFAMNILFNVVFTPIQFGLRNNALAAADILLVLATLVWSMVMVWPHMRWVAYVNMGYLAWVLFATALQLTITYLNRH
jgi:benzodiazapine receptor